MLRIERRFLATITLLFTIFVVIVADLHPFLSHHSSTLALPASATTASVSLNAPNQTREIDQTPETDKRQDQDIENINSCLICDWIATPLVNSASPLLAEAPPENPCQKRLTTYVFSSRSHRVSDVRGRGPPA
jgi:hypothetical protein